MPKASKPTRKLRPSLENGTICILLSGVFKGRRVVILKQLSSGLLLVTGPYKINHVPLRRVDAAYVIATSQKIDISGLDLNDIDDSMFNSMKTKSAKSSDAFFTKSKEVKKTDSVKIEKQKIIDEFLMKRIEAVPQLNEYLAARFSLSRNEKPHEMMF